MIPIISISNLVNTLVMAALAVRLIYKDRRHCGVILGILNVMVGLIFVIGRFLNPVPHLPIVIVPYVFWQETYPLLLRALTGISTFTSTTIFMGVFFYLGHKERDNTIIYRRSMYLASGMLFLVLASFIFFLASTGGFVVSILASGSCIVGAYLMLRGISYESPKEPAVPPTP